MPILWVLTTLPSAATGSGLVDLFTFPLLVFGIGLAGTVRLAFALDQAGRPAMSFAEMWAATWRYLGRFLCLGLCLVPVLIPPGVVAYAIGGGGTLSNAAFALVVAVLDVVATFIPPALALSTSRVTQAVKDGWRVLREGWPQHRWHALVPPLAIQVVALTNLRDVPVLIQLAVLLVGGIVGIILRGATTAAYLRACPLSATGPSWLDGRPPARQGAG